MGQPRHPVKACKMVNPGNVWSYFNLAHAGERGGPGPLRPVPDTRSLMDREGGASSSGSPNSIPFYSLHRSVGNLRSPARIHPRFPMLISPARPTRRRFSADFLARLPNTRDFLTETGLAGLRPPPGSPPNRHDFLRRRIARHFRSLPRQGPVSVGGPAIARRLRPNPGGSNLDT